MKPLSAGDLVQIIGKNCEDGFDEDSGTVFTVARIYVGLLRCQCGHTEDTTFAMHSAKGWYPQRRLKRIDPPAKLETESATKDNEVTA